VAAGKRFFFLGFAALAAAAVLTGFSRTFLVPLARGTFSAPVLVYVHAACFGGWIVLLVAQSALAAAGKLRWHRRIGWTGAFLIPAMGITGVGVGLLSTIENAPQGDPNDSYQSLFGTVTTIGCFVILASIAFLARRRPPAHKRLMAMATIALLGAAFGRIPELASATAWILRGLIGSVAVYDLVTARRLHLATVSGGLALIGMNLLQPLGATHAWQSVAPKLVSWARPYF